MSGELFIQVLAGRRLRDVEGFGGGKNDPYTKVIHFSSKGERVAQTPHINEAGSDPVWHNAEFKFEIGHAASEELKVEVWDHNVGKDVIIGSTVFQMTDAISPAKEGAHWYPIYFGPIESKKEAGEIQLGFSYRPNVSVLASVKTAAPAPQSQQSVQREETKRNPEELQGPPTFERRRQTATVLMFFLVPWLCLWASFFCLRASGYVLYSFLAYCAFIFLVQDYHKKGGYRQQWFRRLAWWKWFRDFFPIELQKFPPDLKLDTGKNYIFGYHPHGIISLGAFINFGTEATDFTYKFPGIYARLCTLSSNFMIPFYGLYLTMFGIIDASKEGILHVLGKGPGHSVVLVLGGAKESLDARPGTYDLTLKDRKGFVKLALLTGAHLVPVMSFGETDLYEQVDNPVGSPLRKLQEKLQDLLGFALPLVKGRGVFNYNMGLLPHRRRITTVVGAPVPVPKTLPADIKVETIDKYHTDYINALQKLYDDLKDKYAKDRVSDLKFVR